MDESKREWPRNLAIILLSLALLIVFIVPRKRSAAALDAPGILREVRLLKELVTVRYSIQKVAGLKQDTSPISSESILLIVQAKVLAGVDLMELSDADIRVKDPHTVSVRLPAPQVLHVYLDEKHTQVWDRTKSWWAPWVPYDLNLEQKARMAALDSVKQEAEEMGILKDAQESAQLLIRSLLRPLGYDHVEFPKRQS